MKGKAGLLRTGRLLLVLLVVSTAASAFPASGQEGRALDLQPAKARIGKTVSISGTGFNKSTGSSDKYAAVYFSSQPATTSEDIGAEVSVYARVVDVVWLDEDGAFTTDFTVPAMMSDGSLKKEVSGGTYYVYVCHYIGETITPRISAVAEFTVAAGEIVLAPSRGTPGTAVTITGNFFTPEAYLTIEYDGQEVGINQGDSRADSKGDFTTAIAAPVSIAGRHTISVHGEGETAEAVFTIEPEVFLERTSGEAGETVSVTGDGFAPQRTVTLLFNFRNVATVRTDAVGSFASSFSVPDLEAGIYDVEIRDVNNNADMAKFTVVVPPTSTSPTPPPPTPSPTITADISAGSAGVEVTLSGANFPAKTLVAISYDGDPVAQSSTDTGGSFLTVFVVPVSRHGEHTITAEGGGASAETVFIIEEKPPPSPLPLEPVSAIKVDQPLIFDWEDVSDESPPVTYDLQIASNNDFDIIALLMERKGLTASNFTPTRAEAARLTVRKAPYYWRVRAIDSAGNVGPWSSATAFSIVSATDDFNRIIYIVVGAVGALLFVLFSSKLFKKK
ncbi:MAG: hypothetical protein ABID87_00930 [Chloroflexota bacterium]